MTTKLAGSILALALLVAAGIASQTVPTEVQQPGTQATEISSPLLSSQCSCCHSTIDPACFFCHSTIQPEADIWENWRGSMMSHASTDPLFWAALTVAEQDFDGSGNLCLRCHVPIGWIEGRATPTDGSALLPSDLDGVSCSICHKLVNPDDSEHIGVQHPPFVANDGGTPKKAYRGSAMYVLWGGAERLGPYSDPVTPHGWMQSKLHRSADLCATCHDVSNPVTGDLAHNNGAPLPLPQGNFSGVLGGPVTTKAAFLNEPHKYGVVERTSSEHRASALDTFEVADLAQLPVELRSGALGRAHEAATLASPDANYADGTTRMFSCQSCHMQPVQGRGCNLNTAPIRQDMPRHDLTGGNTWMPLALKWLSEQGRLRTGPIVGRDLVALDRSIERARTTLRNAAGLSVEGDTVFVVNRTGHKLITGYPEGRRMWLRTRWYAPGDVLLRTDGEYGGIEVEIGGADRMVKSLLAPNDPTTHVWEAKLGITQTWAAQLLAMGSSPSLPLSFERTTGAVTMTLGQLAARPSGTEYPTLHFVLNNTTLSDNRIPPYGLSYDEAREYNALPVPPTQFGNPGPGGTFRHWDEVALQPPPGAARAEIELLYQTTSWEYVQFLYLANQGTHPTLSGTGQDVLDAWLATGMSEPEIIATARWGADQPQVYCTAKVNSLGCVPEIGWYGTPSASAGEGFQVVARNLRNNKAGLLLVSRAGRAATPFQGGTLCVASPFKRVNAGTTGGTPAGANCSGGLSVDFNRQIAQGLDPALVGGVTVDVQFWSRDPGFPAPDNTSLTDGLEFTLLP